MTVTGAARALDKSASLFSGKESKLPAYQRGGVAALLQTRRDGSAQTCDLTIWIETLPWFIPAARYFYMATNRTHNRGSVPDAVLQTLSLPALPSGWRTDVRERFLLALKPACVVLPTCPPELREAVLARQAAGQDLVPPRVARKIRVAPTVVQMHRSPRAWSLDNLSAPGSQRRYFNRDTSQREIMTPGDWFGGDDATPGIAVCVPSKEVNTPCSQRYGVLLGRFQWLVYNDCRTDRVLGWDYVVRPRGSYRAEDVVNGMGTVTRTHGIPRRGWQFEGGTFNSRLVRQCIELLGCDHWRTYSPHQKAVESIFNRVWTRLAVQFPHADMGRYRNENEANCALYEACKRAHKDPRKIFPTLAEVLAVFEEEVKSHNAKRIHSEQYGQWVPDEFFHQAVTERPLRQFSAEMAWMFHPYSIERKVRKMQVRTRVAMFEDFSVPFEFHADWMSLFDGCQVRLHFNPRDPQAVAKVVLLQNCGQHKAGAILGDAKMIGETAGHIRMVMGWAEDDQRAGYIARQRAAQFMRRETRGVAGTGRAYRASEERDGLGSVSKVEVGGQAGTSNIQQPASNIQQPTANSEQGTMEADFRDRVERAAKWEKEHALEFL